MIPGRGYSGCIAAVGRGVTASLERPCICACYARWVDEYVHKISDSEDLRIQRFLKGMVWGVLAFLGLIVAAYVTADRWLLLISPESEKRFIEPYIELARSNFLTPGDEALEAYVADLSAELTTTMQVPEGLMMEVRLIQSDTANAVTTLGGYIFVTEELLLQLDNENSLAMVLAHEIAHAAERHPLLGTGRGMLIALVISTLSGSNPTPATIGDLGSQLMLNRYSRGQEEEADLIALRALQDYYGHIGGATQFFERMQQQSGGEEDLVEFTSPETELFSTHPNLDRRIEYIEATAAREEWQGLAVTPYPPSIEAQLKKL